MNEIILLADNDLDFREARRALLEERGYRVVPASGPEEAKAILDSQLIDVAVLDLRLNDDSDPKDVSGLTLARTSSRTIPKIILTDHATIEAAISALHLTPDGLPPAVRLVKKSDGHDALLTAIQEALQFTSEW